MVSQLRQYWQGCHQFAALCRIPVMLGILLCCLSNGCDAQTRPAVRDGDIIFQQSRSAQSLAIQQATGSRYSHMGLILFRDGKPYVFEAAATVKYTPLAEWIARGERGHFVVKRLNKADQVLTPAAVQSMRHAAKRFTGKPYDLTFEWSNRRMYCSELVWKIYDRSLGIKIGALQKIRDFNLQSPAVKQKLRERYGKNVPLDEPVISPKAMFDSPLLVTVTQG